MVVAVNDLELLRKATLEALKEGEGTASLIYADALEELNEGEPEFFRALGRQVQQYPDWIYHHWSAKELGSRGSWCSGTQVNSYIQKAVADAHRHFAQRRGKIENLWLGVGEQLADRMARSRELCETIYPTRQNIVNKLDQRQWVKFGIPTHLYGYKIRVLDLHHIPQFTAVVLSESSKVFGLITECVW